MQRVLPARAHVDFKFFKDGLCFNKRCEKLQGCHESCVRITGLQEEVGWELQGSGDLQTRWSGNYKPENDVETREVEITRKCSRFNKQPLEQGSAECGRTGTKKEFSECA